jgi:protein tyrosine/serine phosphatase
MKYFCPFLLTLTAWFTVNLALAQLQPTNFHVVEEGKLYRSGQPNPKEMQALEQMGIKTIFNLRFRINNRREVKNTQLVSKRLKLKAQSIDLQDMLDGLRIIRDSEAPVLVHCLHGSDRTGCLVACYRMVFQGWSREAAIEEFLREEMGYNYRWFPNLKLFLENFDIQQAKSYLEVQPN